VAVVRVVAGAQDGDVRPEPVGLLDLDLAVETVLVDVLVEGRFAVRPSDDE
jgi:hypothetical protein